MLALLTLLACSPDVPDRDRPVTVGALEFDGPPPRNVLMISIDTFRRDHFGRYSGEGEDQPTPFLSALAEEGVVLDDHTQCSNWTWPAMVCTLGGRPPLETGLLPSLNHDEREPVPPGTPFLASWLADAGYDTWLLSSNVWLSSEWGTSEGYAHELDVDAITATTMMERGTDAFLAGRDPDAPWLFHIHLLEPHVPYRAPASWMTELDELEPVPWDLDEFKDHYEVLNDIWPTLGPDERDLLEQHLRIRYHAEIAWLDSLIAEQFERFEAEGLLDDTLVVVWSDHGEQFWEHGHQTHAWTLHAEENDAFAFFWARNLKARPWAGPTEATDLVPTLLAIQGLERPPEVTGAIVGTAPTDRIRTAHALGRREGEDMVERDGKKLIFDWEGSVRAYDRAVDPDETTDLWDPSDPTWTPLWDHLRDRVERESELAPWATLSWPEEVR